MIQPSVSGSILVTQNDIQTSTVTTPTSTTSRGRGRGRGTGTKRGRGKKDAGGVGRGGAVGATAGGANDGANLAAGANMEEDGGMEGEAVAAEKPPEMLRVGSLFIKSSIFDDILTERKLELFSHPSVQQFLKKNRICS